MIISFNRSVMNTFQELLTEFNSLKNRPEDDKELLKAKRALKDYTSCQKKLLRLSFKKMNADSKHQGIVFVSKDQREVAAHIYSAFKEGCQIVTLIAQPQWGKTGSVLASAYFLCTKTKSQNAVDSENVFIITGLSDTEWERQTRERMLPQFKDNIYHRAKMHKVIPKLSSAKNALIIIDECHYGSRNDQQLKSALEEAGLLDLKKLQTDNIKILQTSATPDNVLVDSNSWGDLHAVVRPPVSKTYVSFEDLLKADRLQESLDLTDPCDAETLFEVMLSFGEPRYHIIRVPRRGGKGQREEVLENVEAFCYDFEMTILYHDSSHRIKDIDKLLSKAPQEHTIIIITDFWRAAKTMVDTHIGVIHERLVQTPNSTTIVQALVGRSVGHNKRLHDGPIIYTNLKAVEQYIELYKNDYDYVETKYSSMGVKSNGEGKIIVKESYVHDCLGVDHQYTVSKNTYGWKLFLGRSPLKAARKFVLKHLGKKLPEKKKQGGFYVQNDITEDPLYVYKKYFRDDRPYNSRIFKGLSGNNAKKATNWRQYALYRDPKDVESLVWFICWRRVIYPNVPSDD